ncbi:MAG: hypothetical protein IH607_00340, partial [Firmicutes bacterium]|nr:hypothetical protein [Bacillota bacterium]
MKKNLLVSLLLIAALCAGLLTPGLAQDVQTEALTQLRFAQLLHDAFPAYAPEGMNEETILTYDQAIAA